MKGGKLLALALFIVLLLAGAYFLYDYLAAENAAPQLSVDGSEVEAGDMDENAEAEELFAPDFTVYDAEGRAVRLSDFRGKPAVLNMWASWCGPCRSEMPHFDSVWAEYGEEFNFLMVNMTLSSRESLENAKEYISEGGYGFPVYYDTEGEAMTAYGAYSIPMTFFIDAEGRLITYARGRISEEILLYGMSLCK